MFITTANIPHAMSPWRRRADVRRAARKGRPRPARVLAFQEVHAEHRPDVRAALAPGWLLMAPKGKPTPLAVSPGWWIEHRAWTPLSDAIPGVQGGRGVSWAVMRPMLQPGLPPIVVGSVHLPNGAFSNPGQRAEHARRDRWAQAHEALVEWHAEREAEGLTVVLAGDLNRVGWRPDWHRRTRTVARAGLMYLTVTPARRGALVRPGNVHVDRGNNGDHPMVSAHLRLSRRR